MTIEDEVTEIAGTPFPWTRVVDPDRLLESALLSGVDGCVEHDPFWAATWRAAIGLDRFIQNQPGLAETDVLELGGGSGRAGIAAAILGANVCITDASRMALMVCRYNARSLGSRVRVRLLDWARPETIQQRFPVIIGSDIVYNPSLYPILEPCMRRLLTSRGVVWLSEPQRHTGDRFESWIRAAGWRCQSSLVDLGDKERAIRIFECRLP
ncbi:MAG: protein N-lysine methyltransferase family protein [Pirellula sp.]|nr:protein N-lysine methyltransferase family protein [Pirellula sp.]